MVPINEVDLIRLNKLGFSLTVIADMFDCHITTVTNRLGKLKLDPVDTRGSFMEDIFNALTLDEQAWLVNELEYVPNIKILLTEMIRNGHSRSLNQ